MSKVISVEQSDGSTLVYSPKTDKTYRFPSFDESLRNDSDDGLWAEVHLSPMIAVACLKELANRNDPDAIRALKYRGVIPWEEGEKERLEEAGRIAIAKQQAGIRLCKEKGHVWEIKPDGDRTLHACTSCGQKIWYR